MWWIGIVIGVIGLIFLIWVIKSIKIVGPEEMAVLVLFGVPVKFRDSGFTFVPFLPGCRLARYPKKLYNLDYEAKVVISKEGEYPKGSGKKYGAQVLLVDSVAYLRFPRGKKLIEILKSQVPTDDKVLLDWTEESVVGSLRVALGKITWKQATENIATPRKEADKLFKAKDGALLKAGFTKGNLKLTIKEIKLPEELKKALPVVDKQRLEAEAAPFEAKQRATETVGAVLEMMAESRGKTLEEIQVLVEKDTGLQKEFLKLSKDLIKRRMAIDGGSFLDIRVAGAAGIERMILNALALWKRTPSGKGGRGGEQGKSRVDRIIEEEGLEE